MGVRDWCEQLPGGTDACGAICILVLITMFGVLTGYCLGIGNQAAVIALIVLMVVLLIGYVVVFCVLRRPRTDEKPLQPSAESRAFKSLPTNASAVEAMPALALKPRDAHAAYTPYREA